MIERKIAAVILAFLTLSILVIPMSVLSPTMARADNQEIIEVPTTTVSVVETTPLPEETIPLDTLIPPEPIPTPEEKLWQQREAKYPVATRLWRHMKSFGWSDEMCAGVIGNVMAETGARTLDIPFKIYKKGPFGLFQWTKGRHKDIVAKYGEDATIEEQLDFVYDELYGTNGVRKQVTNTQREKMLSAETPEKAAKYFCIWFERPGGKGTVRPRYARIAYDYFTSEGA